MRMLRTPGPGGLAIVLAIAVILLTGAQAMAYSSYFAARCASCHGDDSTSCVGCHHHSGPLSAQTDDVEYAPNDQVTVTLQGGTRGGWVRGLLFDENDTEIDRASGPTGTGDDGLPNPITYPVTLSALAPAAEGTYTWHAAWFGSADAGGGTHETVQVPVTVTVVDNTPVESSTWGQIKSIFR